MGSNFESNTLAPDVSGVDYHLLQNVEMGSVAHLEAVKTIQAQERAAEIAFRNTLQGDGRSGHAYASYTIVPNDLLPSYESRTLGAMREGVSSPDLRDDIVKIGGMETNKDIAEAMRRSMSAAEWTALTGLPYTSLTQVQHQYPDAKAREAAKLEPIQEQLAAVNAADDLAKAEEDAARMEQEQALQNVPPSVLETVMVGQYGPDMTESISREVVDKGEFDIENLSKLGVDQPMVEDTIKYYTDAAAKMLAPVNSCVAYLENFLNDAEAKTMRQALMGRDLSKVQTLGERARDRAAGMTHAQVSEFLSSDERIKLNLRQRGRLTTVTLPGVGETSWGNAVSAGLISFS